MKVTIIQLGVADGSPEENLQNVENYIARAPKGGIVLLPELWSSGYDLARVPSIATRWTPLILGKLRELAKRNDQIVGGSLVSLSAESKLVNRFWLVFPERTPIFYDKGHLFPFFNEHNLFDSGKTRVVCNLGELRFGLSVCFDLRFAEQYRLDALAGAEAFLICAAWPAARIDIMITLARARAIENQAFVVLSNRVGYDSSGQKFGGQSVIVDPFGKVMCSGGQEETVVHSEINREDVLRCREQLNCLTLRRPGLDF